jgi:hypothetical protein
VTVTGGALYGDPALYVMNAAVNVAGTSLIGAHSVSQLGGVVTQNGPALLATRARVWLSRADLQGGNGMYSLFLTYEGEPAIDATDSDIVVTGDGTTTLSAGRRPGGSPVPAIRCSSGTLTLDSNVRLLSFNAPLVTGTSALTVRRVVSLLPSGGQIGGQLALEVVCPAGNPFSLLAGLPDTGIALPCGTLFIDPPTMIDAWITVQDPSERTTTFVSVPNTATLRGLTLALQAIELSVSTGRLELSNAAAVVPH